MRQSIQTETGTLFYRIEGKGPVLVLIHGFGADGRIWDFIETQLSKDYTLVIPDLPGFGNSNLSHPDKLSIDSMAKSIRQVFLKHNLENAVMIGHSMGGYVALAYQELFPGDLKALGLFHSHVYKDGADKVGNREKAIDFIQKNGSKYFVREFYKTIFHETFISDNKEIFHEYKSFASEIPPETLVRATRAMMKRPDREHVLKDTDLPILFIFGKHDQPMPLELCMKQVELPFASTVHILKQSGHMGMMEEPKKCVEIIREFVNLLD